MTNRRQVIESGLALSLAATGAFTLAPAAAAAQRLRLELFVFDRRFPDAVAAAQRAAAGGVVLAEIAGDLTRLWYDDLDARWRAAPMMLGGVTTQSALFVLETFAADRGMRVLERRSQPAAAAYDAALSEPLYSWIIAPRGI